MKTEKEFSNNLRQTMRRRRHGMWLMRLIKRMNMTKNVYFAYEQGELPMTAYQLYQFIHLTGYDIDFLREIFDDNWQKLPQHLRAPDNR